MTTAAVRRPGSLQGPLWRSVAVFRLAALGYAGTLIVLNHGRYAHPLAAWPVLVVMAGWTAFTWWAYAHPAWRRWPLLLADLLVTLAVVLATSPIVGGVNVAAGMATLAVAWLVSPVLAWAVAGGRRVGLLAAVLMGGAEVSVRGNYLNSTITGATLMILAAVAVGHVARLSVRAEQRLQRAIEMEAATRERERLARDIHDSVLQVLAMVQRRGAHLDGEAGELARLAGEQEAALRTLVGTARTPSGDAGTTDLCTILIRYAGPLVSVVTPADPVPLPERTATGLGAAVGAALDNVVRHCPPGTRAWVLVEGLDGGEVRVTVRDDGPGIPDGRLIEAAAQGRLGVATSIRGRLTELGGTATVTSEPGAGTEVELHLPGSPAPRR